MSIYVACQCGQAFSAPLQLAGQTVPCPMCQRPITVPLQGAGAPPTAAASQGPFGGPAYGVSDPFGMPQSGGFGGPAMPQQGFAMGPALPAKSLAPSGEDSPLLVWLSIGGGGFALLLIIGLLIYNATATRSPSTPTAAAPAAPAASTPVPVAPATTTPPATSTPTATPTTSTTSTAPATAAVPATTTTTAQTDTATAGTSLPAGSSSSPMSNTAPSTAGATSSSSTPSSPFPFGPNAPGGQSLADAVASGKIPGASMMPTETIVTRNGQYELRMPTVAVKFEPQFPGGGPNFPGGGPSAPIGIPTMYMAQGKQTKEAMYCFIDVPVPANAQFTVDPIQYARVTLSGIDEKTKKERKTTVAGVEATEFEYTMDQQGQTVSGRSLVFVAGGTPYALQVMAVGDIKLDSAEIDAFFASFKKRDGSAAAPAPANATPSATANITPSPAPMPAANDSFRRPGHGQMVAVGEFEAWFPERPLEGPLPSELSMGLEGNASTTKMCMGSDSQTVFMLVEVKSAVPVTGDMLAKWPQSFLGNPRGSKGTKTTVNGFEALDITFETQLGVQTMHSRSLLVAAGNSMFVLGVMGDPKIVAGEDAKAFFASFRKKN